MRECDVASEMFYFSSSVVEELPLLWHPVCKGIQEEGQEQQAPEEEEEGEQQEEEA